VASGKGGTGKTTVATNLAFVASRHGKRVWYLDCDVEEPNGHVFLRPQITQRQSVTSAVPVVDEARCTLCGACGEICQFSAIVCLGTQVMLFPELCHSCGGCQLVCPTQAIAEQHREIGKLAVGRSGEVRFADGLLNIGQAMSPPVIRAVKETVCEAELVIVDAPPGTSCPVIESIRGCDLALLVTEPTPFGVNDLKLAIQMMKEIGIPCEVVINRATSDGVDVHSVCLELGVPVIAELPDDRRVAEAYSRGELAAQGVPGMEERFVALLTHLEQRP